MFDFPFSVNDSKADADSYSKGRLNHLIPFSMSAQIKRPVFKTSYPLTGPVQVAGYRKNSSPGTKNYNRPKF